MPRISGENHVSSPASAMTIPEAVQLVLQAGAIGKGGEVFVLDMPLRVASS